MGTTKKKTLFQMHHLRNCPISWLPFSFFHEKMSIEVRVTRFGDFSPLGRLFTLGSFIKNTQLAQICVLLISNVKLLQ
jgi:hypothetical protein